MATSLEKYPCPTHQNKKRAEPNIVEGKLKARPTTFIHFLSKFILSLSGNSSLINGIQPTLNYFSIWIFSENRIINIIGLL